jgi:P pilus assembly chaperone PapD
MARPYQVASAQIPAALMWRRHQDYALTIENKAYHYLTFRVTVNEDVFTAVTG